MAAPARLTVVAALPSIAGFRRAVAVDGAGRSQAVAISFPPPPVVADPARREALLRAAVAAGKVRHPGIAQVLGVETVDGELAVVEEYRPGTPLRALLDAAGRTPPDVAVRIGLDVAAALSATHAVEVAGVRLAHGAVDAAAIVVREGGELSLCGLGLVAGATRDADIRALGAVLHECVAGEPPSSPSRPIDVPGVPPALAAAVDRATGAVPDALDGMASLAAALGAALASPAASCDVAAYVDVIVPPDEGARAALRTTLAGAIDRVATASSVPAPVPAPLQAAVAAPQVPQPAPLQAAVPAPLQAPAPAPLQVPQPTPLQAAVPAPQVPQPAPLQAAVPAPQQVPQPAPSTVTPPDSARTFPRPAAPPSRSRLPVVAGGVVALAIGFAVGLAAQRALRRPPAPVVAAPAAQPEVAVVPEARPEPVVPAPAPPPPPLTAPPRREPTPAPKAGKRAASAPRSVGKGSLDVTAPDDAEIFLDGRRVGRGSVRSEIGAGPHRIEVRRGGAVVRERFTLAPGENWTYTVTPTP